VVVVEVGVEVEVVVVVEVVAVVVAVVVVVEVVVVGGGATDESASREGSLVLSVRCP
jgi:hypothetical protein